MHGSFQQHRSYASKERMGSESWEERNFFTPAPNNVNSLNTESKNLNEPPADLKKKKKKINSQPT